jgi:hypothetical protein
MRKSPGGKFRSNQTGSLSPCIALVERVESDSRNQFWGEVTVSESKRTLKQRAVHGMREYFVNSLYLFIVFSLFILYKSVILAEHHIDFAMHGFALINALALAKVMLIAQELHLADQFRDAPLIYPTLLKSFVFTILLAGFNKSLSGCIVASRLTKASPTSALDLGREFCLSRAAVHCAYSLFWLHRAAEGL